MVYYRSTADSLIMNALSLLTRRVAPLAARQAPILGTQVYRTMMARVKTFAVDAPDGSSEALMDAEVHQVEDIISHAADFEDRAFVELLHKDQQDAAKIFAVDAPDGEADDIHEKDLHVVEQVIDHAYKHENRDSVIRAHLLDDAMKEKLQRIELW